MSGPLSLLAFLFVLFSFSECGVTAFPKSEAEITAKESLEKYCREEGFSTEDFKLEQCYQLKKHWIFDFRSKKWPRCWFSASVGPWWVKTWHGEDEINPLFIPIGKPEKFEK